MKENKLTDSEIIKVLECCASGKNCEECSLNCEAPTTKDILDLFNRKDAEIERLNVELIGIRGACNSYKMHYHNAQTEIENAHIGVKSYKNKYESAVRATKEYQSVIVEKDAEIERLSKEIEALNYIIMQPYHEEKDKCEKCEKELRAEAIKEFWSELKKRSTLDWRVVSTITGDNLVKEMTEPSLLDKKFGGEQG